MPFESKILWNLVNSTFFHVFLCFLFQCFCYFWTRIKQKDKSDILISDGRFLDFFGTGTGTGVTGSENRFWTGSENRFWTIWKGFFLTSQDFDKKIVNIKWRYSLDCSFCLKKKNYNLKNIVTWWLSTVLRFVIWKLNKNSTNYKINYTKFITKIVKKLKNFPVPVPYGTGIGLKTGTGTGTRKLGTAHHWRLFIFLISSVFEVLKCLIFLFDFFKNLKFHGGAIQTSDVFFYWLFWVFLCIFFEKQVIKKNFKI